MVEGIRMLREQRGPGSVTFNEVADHLYDYCDLHPEEAAALAQPVDRRAGVRHEPRRAHVALDERRRDRVDHEVRRPVDVERQEERLVHASHPLRRRGRNDARLNTTLLHDALYDRLSRLFEKWQQVAATVLLIKSHGPFYQT